MELVSSEAGTVPQFDAASGNSHLRRLFIHGARSASLHMKREKGLDQFEMRTHKNVVVVALANKIVRISWAVLARQEEYRQPMPIAA